MKTKTIDQLQREILIRVADIYTKPGIAISWSDTFDEDRGLNSGVATGDVIGFSGDVPGDNFFGNTNNPAVYVCVKRQDGSTASPHVMSIHSARTTIRKLMVALLSGQGEIK